MISSRQTAGQKQGQKELQEQEQQGHFIGLVLLGSLWTHILSFTGPKAKYSKHVCVSTCEYVCAGVFVCVCVYKRNSGGWGHCLLMQAAHVGQGHIMLA